MVAFKKFQQGKVISTGCFLDYNYFKDYYQMMVVESSKQKALDADPKAVQ